MAPGSMPEFDGLECGQCGEAFAAHPDSNAADRGCCSPTCATAGEGLP